MQTDFKETERCKTNPWNTELITRLKSEYKGNTICGLFTKCRKTKERK